MKNIYLISFFLFLFFTTKVYAQSDYVLPYPSFMPGNKLYILQEIKNTILQYWYFGNFGQFTYNLRQSDKFLVEAKTLFEYKQFLLADKALKKSDYFFDQTFINLEKAKQENKNISEKKDILREAALKHNEVLTKLSKELPENFIWQPEKSSSTKININEDINTGVKVRQKAI